MARHNETGKKGEALAASYLQQQGFTVLHSNWRHERYEIDIIASREEVLHFIEVKTRQSLSFGLPEESVTYQKIRHIVTAGVAFQCQYPSWKRVQYDVLSIVLVDEQPPEYLFIEDVYLL
jgi:putative endonuclease